MIVGIDPGFSGAIAMIDSQGAIVELFDMPILMVGKRRELDEVVINSFFASQDIKHIYIEKAQSMPAQGVASTFRYGASYGILRGICVGQGIPYTLVHPKTWKKETMRDMQKGKEASIVRVGQLYPAFKLTRKKDHGKADSILLALFGLHKGV